MELWDIVSIVSRVGEFLNSGISRVVEKIGDGISWLADRFSQTSKKVGRMDAYDEDDFRETVNFSEMLAELQVDAEKKFNEAEKEILNTVEKSLEKIVEDILENEKSIKRTLKNEARKIKRNLEGDLSLYLKKRYSIDNSECKRILMQESGIEKERNIDRFLKNSLDMALREENEKIKEEVEEFLDILAEELDNDNEIKMEKMENTIKELEEVIRLKEEENENIEEINIPNYYRLFVADSIQNIL